MSDVQAIFDPSCGCHIRDDPAGDLDLSAGMSYGALVGVDSASTLKLVVPGDADASYLVHKLEGTQDSVGGGGGKTMPPPPNNGPLGGSQIQMVRDWVQQGAVE